MAQLRSLLDVLDAKPLVVASRVRLGPLRMRGVPAILCGVAAIVAAAGASAALQRFASAVPETLREARLLWVAVRSERASMLS